jgi:uncharacterized protein (DUF849 family)
LAAPAYIPKRGLVSTSLGFSGSIAGVEGYNTRVALENLFWTDMGEYAQNIWKVNSVKSIKKQGMIYRFRTKEESSLY